MINFKNFRTKRAGRPSLLKYGNHFSPFIKVYKHLATIVAIANLQLSWMALKQSQFMKIKKILMITTNKDETQIMTHHNLCVCVNCNSPHHLKFKVQSSSFVISINFRVPSIYLTVFYSEWPIQIICCTILEFRFLYLILFYWPIYNQIRIFNSKLFS